jgi:hypothetical protein
LMELTPPPSSHKQPLMLPRLSANLRK